MHFVVKHTWWRLAAEYDLLKGRVWVLILLWLLVLPYVIHRLRT